MSARRQMAFAIPIYNHAHQLERTLESILAQSFSEFGVVAVDDCSTDDSVSILERYAAQDSRLHIVRNERRLGYTRNAVKGYRLCREVFPSIEFFAWGSDHDLWHPHWLRLLIDQLRAEPEASLAWSWRHVITGEGEIVRSLVDSSEGGQSADRRRRIIYSAMEAPAGSFLHGLIRIAALDKTSGLRMVLVPDRLLIAELAAIGTFALVPEFLWQRRYFGLASRTRQRRNSFPEGAPLYSYLPITLQHCSVLLYDFSVRRLGAPAISSWEGYKVARDFMVGRMSYRREHRARAKETKTLHERRRRKGASKKRKTRLRPARRAVRNWTHRLYQLARKPLTRRFWQRRVFDNLRKLYHRGRRPLTRPLTRRFWQRRVFDNFRTAYHVARGAVHRRFWQRRD